MRKTLTCICALMLLFTACSEKTQGIAPSGAPQISSDAGSSLSSEAAEESEIEESEPEPDSESVKEPTTSVSKIDDKWTAYSVSFPPNDNIGQLRYCYGEIAKNKYVFISSNDNDDEEYQSRLVVLDASDLSNMKIAAVKRQSIPDKTYYDISLRPGMVLCQYGAVTEIMDETLETVRTIEIPSNEKANIWRYDLNDDFSMATYSTGDIMDFENCTIVVQPLDGTGERIEFSTFMKAGDYHSALMRPKFAANGTKLIAPQVGFEFTASYVLMDLSGQNRQSYNRGGYFKDVDDKIIGNDVYIKNIRIEREGDSDGRYPQLHKIDTVTGEETPVYNAAEKQPFILDFYEKYALLFRITTIPEGNKYIRDKFCLYDYQSGNSEQLPDQVNELLRGDHNRRHVTADGRIIITQVSDKDTSAIVTMFCKE